MATETTKTTKTGTSTKTVIAGSDLWARLTSGARQLTADTSTPWAEANAGTIISGIVLGRFEMDSTLPSKGPGDDGMRHYYQIRLDDGLPPIKAMVLLDDKWVPGEVTTGKINVDRRKAMEAVDDILDQAMEAGRQAWVAIMFVEKAKTRRTKTDFWRIEVAAKLV